MVMSFVGAHPIDDRRIRSLASQKSGRTGLIVHGAYRNGTFYVSQREAWVIVQVSVDGRPSELVSHYGANRVKWVEVAPGRHLVELSSVLTVDRPGALTASPTLYSERVHLEAGRQLLIQFRPRSGLLGWRRPAWSTTQIPRDPS